MKSRSTAREIALCLLFQHDKKGAPPAAIERISFNDMLMGTIQTLCDVAKEQLQGCGNDITDCITWVEDEEMKHPVNQRVSLDQPLKPAPIPSTKEMLSKLHMLLGAVETTYMALELPELHALSQREDVQNYAYMLCRTTLEHLSSIDELINTVSIDWKVDRLQKMDKWLLRIAIAEGLHGPDVQAATIVDEYLSLAKRYSSDDSRSYIHGVLGQALAQVESSDTPKAEGTAEHV